MDISKLYNDNNCCDFVPNQELDGFVSSCSTNRICEVNAPIGSQSRTCEHRICEARTLTIL
jgi:hypothetical protein